MDGGSYSWWGRCDVQTSAAVSSFLDVGLDSGAETWHWRNLGTGESVGNEKFCVTLESDELMNLLLISDHCLAVSRLTVHAKVAHMSPIWSNIFSERFENFNAFVTLPLQDLQVYETGDRETWPEM